MLVLSRKVSQQIQIGSDILITIVKIDRGQVRVGISAPEGVTILRAELLDEWHEQPREEPLTAYGSRPSARLPDGMTLSGHRVR